MAEKMGGEFGRFTIQTHFGFFTCKELAEKVAHAFSTNGETFEAIPLKAAKN